VLEDLGSDAHVFFQVDAPAITAESLESGDGPSALGGGALLTARVDLRTAARVGGRVDLAVDPARFHFFDAQTGRRLERTPSLYELTASR
jgi:hypothetical protein